MAPSFLLLLLRGPKILTDHFTYLKPSSDVLVVNPFGFLILISSFFAELKYTSFANCAASRFFYWTNGAQICIHSMNKS